MPRSERSGLLTVVAFAAVAAVVGLTALPVAARAFFVLPLVVYLPGAALWSAVFPEQPPTAETRALAVALSLALTVLCGLTLNFVDCLTPIGWAFALAGFTILATLVGLARRAARPAVNGTASIGVREAHPLGPRWNRAAFAGAAVLALAAVFLARHGAQAQREYRYTEFWMVPAKGDHPSLATLGLTNEEQAAATYDIDILLEHKLLDRWPPITLEPGETRTAELALPQEANGGRLEAQLFKDGDRSSVYRKVWVSVPPSRSATESALAGTSDIKPSGPNNPEAPGKSPIFKSQILEQSRE